MNGSVSSCRNTPLDLLVPKRSRGMNYIGTIIRHYWGFYRVFLSYTDLNPKP